MNFLAISGGDVSQYISTMSISHEPIWNTKAGRTLTGDFAGKIVARKWKLQFTTIPLSQTEMVNLLTLIESNSFFGVEFIPLNSNSKITRTFYVNAPTTEVYSYNDELSGLRYKSLNFHFVEK